MTWWQLTAVWLTIADKHGDKVVAFLSRHTIGGEQSDNTHSGEVAAHQL